MVINQLEAKCTREFPVNARDAYRRVPAPRVQRQHPEHLGPLTHSRGHPRSAREVLVSVLVKDSIDDGSKTDLLTLFFSALAQGQDRNFL